MDASGTQSANRDYYDSFSLQYERHRGRNDPGGYHELLDELESEFVGKFAKGADVLEVGCGTGLVLHRISTFARSAKGVDLSPGMLEKARERGLDVVEGSALELPFPDASFDVTCSFKVLAHIPEIEKALGEMARVTRPGGTIVAEYYNPFSFRGLVKKLTPPRAISNTANEGHVFTRFDSPQRARELAPHNCEFLCSRGIRIFTPTAFAMRVPGLRQALRLAETNLCDSPAKFFGGFYAAAYRKIA
jgi:ubiquinone/menaquinone biosynthesis C-methylase UbiE